MNQLLALNIMFKIKCRPRMLYALRNCISLTCFVTTAGTRGETMSSVAKVVNHRDVFEGIRNKWKWEWLSKVVKVGETDERTGTHFCKIMRGTARCCSKDVAYGIKKKRERKELDDVKMHDCDANKTSSESEYLRLRRF